MSNIDQFEQRIAELEMRATFQDDLIEQLNQSLIEYQKDLRRLTQIVERVTVQLEDMRQPSIIDASLETPPPHY